LISAAILAPHRDQGRSTMTEFDAVASGMRRRSRWRCPQGWVRAEWLADTYLRLRGPRSELLRLWDRVRDRWTCLRHSPDHPPVHPHDADGQYELLLVPPTDSYRQPRSRSPGGHLRL
jgi:hypothetical protein